MTYEARLHQFYNQFGTAYPSTGVPDKAALPYIVYEVPYGDYINDVSGTVSVYDHTESEAKINAVAKSIRDGIGSGITLTFDGGAVILHKGNPEQINQNFQDDPSSKLRQLNVTYSKITL